MIGGRPVRQLFARLVNNFNRYHCRNMNRRRDLRSTDARATVEVCDPSAEQLATMMQAEDVDRVRAATVRLPEPQRQVISARFDGGLTQGEIAAMLGVTVSAVKNRFRVAYANLERLLGIVRQPRANPAGASE